MTVTCPEGHPSESTDYCDVCGAPIAARTPGTPDPAETAATAGQVTNGPATCPHCGFPAIAGALFCENCGYDFTTGSAPEAANPLDVAALSSPHASPRPSATVPEAAAVPEASGASGASTPPAPAGSPAPGGSPAPVLDPVAAHGTGPAAAQETGPAEGTGWVVELWIDPDWYAAQQPDEPMPSAGPPGLVVLRERSVLVGRPSVSRGIRPQVDCGADSGVSRRHCQLTTDGQRWWVEDLQSSNGTYVGATGEPLPTDPLAPGVRRELEEGDRIYLGAWTRLVLREALPGEA